MDKKEIDKAEIKARIIALHFQTGMTAQELAAQYGQATSTVYRWLQQARKEGLEVYERKAPAPHEPSQVPIQKTDSEEVKQLKRELSDARLMNKYYRALAQVVREEFGIDMEKKPGAKR